MWNEIGYCTAVGRTEITFSVTSGGRIDGNTDKKQGIRFQGKFKCIL